MRDPQRIPLVLEAVRKAWERVPDLRLAQLIGNVAGYGTEDEALLEGLQMYDHPFGWDRSGDDILSA